MADPREQALLAINADIGRTVKGALPRGVGFALLIFDLGDSGFMTYTSSARREDMIKAIRELLGKLEEEPHPHG